MASGCEAMYSSTDLKSTLALRMLVFRPGFSNSHLDRRESADVSATPASLKTYSCWPSRMISARLPLRSALTNSNPGRVGSMRINEMVPSSFLREATLLFQPLKAK